MPAILATQEAEIRRITVQSQLRQIVCKTLSWKTLHKNRAGGVAQGRGPEFKSQYHKNKEKKKEKGHNLRIRDCFFPRQDFQQTEDFIFHIHTQTHTHTHAHAFVLLNFPFCHTVNKLFTLGCLPDEKIFPVCLKSMILLMFYFILFYNF
jgi:hypothetical protein